MPTNKTGEALSLRRSGYLPTLDGWRALAIVSVIFYHDRVYRFHGLSTAPIAHFGRFGVELFFGISGLLICTRLLEEESLTGKLNLKNFYIRRVLRIQPAALLMLWSTALLMVFNLLEPGWADLATAATLVRNYLPLHSAHTPDWVTGHFWSLSVEEHFYLFLPFFLLLCKRHRAKLLLLATVVDVAWCVAAHFLFHEREWALQQTDRCICYLTLPAAVAVLLRGDQVRSWMRQMFQPWPVLMAAAALLLSVRVGNPLCVLAPPVLVVSTLLHPGSSLSRALELAPIRFIGRISFGLYLWQELFFTGRYLSVNPLGVLGDAPWNFLMTGALAIASYYLVEKPCMRLGHKLARPALEGRPELAPAYAQQPRVTPGIPAQHPVQRPTQQPGQEHAYPVAGVRREQPALIGSLLLSAERPRPASQGSHPRRDRPTV